MVNMGIFKILKKDHELLLNMVRMWTKNGLCTKTRKEKQNVQKEKKITNVSN